MSKIGSLIIKQWKSIFHRLRMSELFRRVRVPGTEQEMEEIERHEEQPLSKEETNEGNN